MHPTTYPSNEDLTVILCEDIREERHGKISLMGLFAGAAIVLKATDDASHRIPSLAIFIRLTNLLPASYQMAVEVKDPDGKIAFAAPEQQVNAVVKANQKKSALVTGIKVNNIDLYAGTYEVNLILDGKRFGKKFDVEILEPAAFDEHLRTHETS